MLRKRHLKNIGLFAFLFFSLHCSARTFVVTDTNDTINIRSLRGAILEANRHGGQNTIILGRDPDPRGHSGLWVYHLTIPGADETAGLKGDLNITRGELTIMGASSNVTIDATELGDRVFNVSSRARLTLENLTITGGNPEGNNYETNLDGEPGGAIYNAGILLLENCSLIGNSSEKAYILPDGANGGNGGAIYNAGQLTMNGCIVAGNTCGDGDVSLLNPENSLSGNGGNGGGIYNSGKMTLNACIISNNVSGQGTVGGIAPIGIQPETVSTIISGNPGGPPGGNGGDGGGIYNAGQAGISFSTIDGNGTGAGGFGGYGGNLGGSGGSGGNGAGIFNSGTLDLNTCTVSENFCGDGGTGGDGSLGVGGSNGGNGGNGGGICNMGAVNLTSGTIAFNLTGAGGNGGNGTVFSSDVPAASGGNGGDGGGIFHNAGTNSVIVRNTLIAQNLANLCGAGGENSVEAIVTAGQSWPPPIFGNPGINGTGFDLAGNFTSQGFNLISTGDGSAGFVNGINADQVGSDANPIDALLGPLQFNGGPTPTHALLWGSPAIDQGNCFGVHTDQRGSHRPYIHSSITKPPGGDGSDIGAFELDTPQN